MPTLAKIKDMTDGEVDNALYHFYGHQHDPFTKSLDALQPIKEGLTPEQLGRFAANLFELSKCGRLVTAECGEDFDQIGALLKEPASIQSRALLAALTE